MSALDWMYVPVEVSWVGAIPWEADLYLILSYK